LLPPDQAAVYYRGGWSLLRQLWRLARQPQWLQRVAAEGQRRVLAEHTQLVRARQLLALVSALPVSQRKPGFSA
jgi:spore maturation protein CgeB